MKKILALVACLSLVASLAIGGSIAYLTDRDSEANVFTIGDVSIDLKESFEQGSELLPGIKIEKEATITNTGDNAAFVWMTIAVPEKLDNIGNASTNPIHWNVPGAFWDDYHTNSDYIQSAFDKGYITENEAVDFSKTWDVDNDVKMETVEIEGKKYHLYTLLYNSAIEPGETTNIGLNQVYMDSFVDIDTDGEMYRVKDGVATKLGWNIKTDSNPSIYVSAYAIQAEGFEAKDNKSAALVAYEAYRGQWGNDLSDKGAGTEYTSVTAVSTNEELKNALTADQETIAVNLAADLTYEVSSHQTFAMGGSSTKKIVINGNGHTLTFNLNDSDWSNVITNNDAKLEISNAKITSGKYNTGHWKRLLIHFNCDTTLNNVTTDKGFGFKKNAALNNVTVNGTDGNYSLWVWVNGQTVDMNNVTVNNPNGRAIKIADEDSDNKPVSLNVSNSKFISSQKAAILATTAYDANITVDNIDISGVAADSTNAVWVDEDRADYADTIVVTGGSKVNE